MKHFIVRLKFNASVRCKGYTCHFTLDKYFKETDVERERAQRKRIMFGDRQKYIKETEIEAIQWKSNIDSTSRQYERAGVLFPVCLIAVVRSTALCREAWGIGAHGLVR